MLPSLAHEVLRDGVDDLSLEQNQGVFHFGVSRRGNEATGFVEFRIEAAIIKGAVFGPKILETNVFRQPFKGVLEAGLGDGFFDAKLQTVPEQFTGSWGRLCGGAQIVVRSLASLAQVVQFGEGHF